MKISRSSGTFVVVVVVPAEGCLDVGITSMGLIETMVESTTPPVEGIVSFHEMSNPFGRLLFCRIVI